MLSCEDEVPHPIPWWHRYLMVLQGITEPEARLKDALRKTIHLLSSTQLNFSPLILKMLI